MWKYDNQVGKFCTNWGYGFGTRIQRKNKSFTIPRLKICACLYQHGVVHYFKCWFYFWCIPLCVQIFNCNSYSVSRSLHNIMAAREKSHLLSNTALWHFLKNFIFFQLSFSSKSRKVKLLFSSTYSYLYFIILYHFSDKVNKCSIFLQELKQWN